MRWWEKATYNDAQSTYNTQEDYGIISFDDNITTIGDGAFLGKTTLTAVEVKKGDKMVTLYAPESVDYIKVE